jgi:hypothetical protein
MRLSTVQMVPQRPPDGMTLTYRVCVDVSKRGEVAVWIEKMGDEEIL